MLFKKKKKKLKTFPTHFVRINILKIQLSIRGIAHLCFLKMKEKFQRIPGPNGRQWGPALKRFKA